MPWFARAGRACWRVAGLCIGFGVAPTDAQQGEVYRIIFVHVPAAWMSMFIYLVMAFWAGDRPGLQHAAVAAHGRARAGADRRAVHLPRAVDRRAVGQADVGRLVGVGRAAHLGADPAVPLPRLPGAARPPSTTRAAPTAPARCWRWSGVVNVPIIYFSVQWWNTLHQGASVSLTTAPSMAHTMLAGMLVMALALLGLLHRGRAGAGALPDAGARARRGLGAAATLEAA